MVKFRHSGSSSIHVVNADFKLSQKEKIGYFLFNAVSNLISKPFSNQFKVHKFKVDKSVVVDAMSLLEKPTSPSRIMSNLFWQELDWKTINANLDGELRVIEVGCGTGRYGLMLNECADITDYLGVDLFSNSEWTENLSEKIKFATASYEDFSDYVSNQNVIITQSALEHFEWDLDFFRSIGEYANSQDYAVLSIHVFPSPSGLLNFLLHGIRQYNRRTIENCVKLAEPECTGNLYVLGGWRSNFSHFVHITLRSLIKREPLAQNDIYSYRAKIESSVIWDCTKNSRKFPSFYALVISWNTGKENLDWVFPTKPNS